MLFAYFFLKSTTCFNFSTLYLKRFWSGKAALKAQATFNPAFYKWGYKLGKKEKNMGDIIGWETDVLNGSSMSITFRMSSQLWVILSLSEEVRRFIVGSCNVDIGRKCDYIQLYRINREACQDDSAGVSLSLS